MLEFLTGVFIILLSIFLLFISSNKNIEYKNKEIQNKTLKEDFLGEKTKQEDLEGIDITDGEEKSGKVVLDKIEKEDEITKKSEEVEKTLKENISKLDKKQEEEKIKNRLEKLTEVFGEQAKTSSDFEKYLDIKNFSDKEFDAFIEKAKKLKEELKMKKEEELKKKQEEEKRQAMEKMKKATEEKQEINSELKDNNIDFSKYISLKQRNKKQAKVYIYKNGKVEEKWLNITQSPIKNTINMVLKDKNLKLSSLVLKNKVLTIKVSNKQNLDSKTKEELTTTAKFFPQVDKVILK